MLNLFKSKKGVDRNKVIKIIFSSFIFIILFVVIFDSTAPTLKDLLKIEGLSGPEIGILSLFIIIIILVGINIVNKSLNTELEK